MTAVKPAAEFGSFFHLDPAIPLGGEPWLRPGDLLAGTGRDALRAIVAQGRSRGWRRLHAPSYYCHAVLDDIARDIDVRLYPHAPFGGPAQLSLADDEAALVPEYFGLRAGVDVQGGSVLLDRSHDLLATWSYARTPDYVFASLRKTLPVPDGGLVRALAGQPFPHALAPTAAHARAAAGMAAAMAMKAAYLAGLPVAKAAYLALAGEAEAALRGDGEISGPTALTRALASVADLGRMRQRRRDNLALLGQCLAGLPAELQWRETPAFGILLCSDAAARERLRQGLIRADVFTAALWPMTWSGVPQSDRLLSERILVLHADYRYSARDIARLGEIILRIVANADTSDEDR
ncbi:hypothetical protein CupriaWKF_20795 [Cupriavidus sp. WKF15]|uniref:hypothetical protein n=1 Tax=Cupriavidus sp. WKF15 TaxID=3032282 RepID=UPI0023E0CC21|nr:hypothetical protein [Cupriavidus sp. WKF15]WER49578.1 hypothetical protein CupriaWKF_20795 [Cupriavidus sp. WKF15]